MRQLYVPTGTKGHPALLSEIVQKAEEICFPNV